MFLFLPGIAFMLAVRFSGLAVTGSWSLPEGLYRVSALAADEPLEHGSIVTLCAPTVLVQNARALGFMHDGPCPGGGEMLMKKIIAFPDDRVRLAADGIRVNGMLVANTRRNPKAPAGLVAIEYGSYRVPPGFAWFAGTSVDSWDSRYYGAIPLDSLRGVAQPIWTIARQ